MTILSSTRLLVTKRSARSMRISAVVRLRHLMFTAPDELRQRLALLSVKSAGHEAARPSPGAWPNRSMPSPSGQSLALAATVACG